MTFRQGKTALLTSQKEYMSSLGIARKNCLVDLVEQACFDQPGWADLLKSQASMGEVKNLDCLQKTVPAFVVNGMSFMNSLIVISLAQCLSGRFV